MKRDVIVRALESLYLDRQLETDSIAMAITRAKIEMLELMLEALDD